MQNKIKDKEYWQTCKRSLLQIRLRDRVELLIFQRLETVIVSYIYSTVNLIVFKANFGQTFDIWSILFPRAVPLSLIYSIYSIRLSDLIHIKRVIYSAEFLLYV